MSKGRSRCVVYVDVDNTLVRKTDSDEIPDPSVIRLVRRLKRNGARLYCWSTGGAGHARRAALKCGIASLFHEFLPKPNIFLDDEPVTKWPDCREVSPRGNPRRIDASLRMIARRSSR